MSLLDFHYARVVFLPAVLIVFLFQIRGRDRNQGFQNIFQRCYFNLKLRENHCIEIFQNKNTLQATLCGHSFPKPNGGDIFLSNVTTSTCLIRPLASGSYSLHKRTNSSRWWGPKIDQSLVKQSKLSIMTATKRLRIKKEHTTKKEMKQGQAKSVPQPASTPASSDLSSQLKQDKIIR